MGSGSADTSPEPSYKSKLPQWACIGGAFVVGIGRAVPGKPELPEWIWKGLLAVGLAACIAGAYFWAFDEVKKINASATRAETFKRFGHLAVVGLVLAATLFLVFRFPSVAQLFKPPEAQLGQKDPAPKPVPTVTPDPRPSIPPEARSTAVETPTQPTSTPSPSSTPRPTSAPSPLPIPAPAPEAGAWELVLLYENDVRTLCGQPQLTVRPSARSGWVLYSKDFLAAFQERPLVVDQEIEIANCKLVLTHIEPNPLRFELKMKWGR